MAGVRGKGQLDSTPARFNALGSRGLGLLKAGLRTARNLCQKNGKKRVEIGVANLQTQNQANANLREQTRCESV